MLHTQQAPIHRFPHFSAWLVLMHNLPANRKTFYWELNKWKNQVKTWPKSIREEWSRTHKWSVTENQEFRGVELKTVHLNHITSCNAVSDLGPAHSSASCSWAYFMTKPGHNPPLPSAKHSSSATTTRWFNSLTGLWTSASFMMLIIGNYRRY